MQLSKSERKFRTKIIQEQHLKKINQIWLDYFCKDISYKDFYLSGARPPKVNDLIQATMNITKQLKKFTSSSMTIAAKIFDEFAQAISDAEVQIDKMEISE